MPDERANAAAEKGRELLLGMLERMGLDADVEVVPQSDAEVDEDDRALVLNIVGDELGVLIGRQNETLSALEFVTRLMVNQQVRTRTNFVVDVNGYRAKRAESLRKLALRMAESWQRGTLPDAFLALVHTDTACEALRAALKKIGVPAPVRQSTAL